MRTRSKKAKGRRLQNWVRDELLKRFPSLNENDVVCAIMGEKGVDIKLSDKAKKSIPFAIECKNQEKFKGIYKIFNQARSHNEEYEPLVFIKMNGKKPLVILDAESFMKDRFNEERFPTSS